MQNIGLEWLPDNEGVEEGHPRYISTVTLTMWQRWLRKSQELPGTVQWLPSHQLQLLTGLKATKWSLIGETERASSVETYICQNIRSLLTAKIMEKHINKIYFVAKHVWGILTALKHLHQVLFMTTVHLLQRDAQRFMIVDPQQSVQHWLMVLNMQETVVSILQRCVKGWEHWADYR